MYFYKTSNINHKIYEFTLSQGILLIEFAGLTYSATLRGWYLYTIFEPSPNFPEDILLKIKKITKNAVFL